MKIKLLLAFFAVGVLTGCGKESAQQPDMVFQQMGKQGLTYFIYIDKYAISSNKQYLDVAKYTCADLKVCVVMFWDEKSKTPRSLPLTDEQLESKVAHYNLNKGTGLNRLQLM